jgi:ribonuclease HI
VKEKNIFVSASIQNNKYIGAYGAIIEDNGKTLELAKFYPTTGYRLRLLGVVAALNHLFEPCEVTVYVDSKYIVNSYNQGWVISWRKSGWFLNNGEEAKNADVWSELLILTEKHNVDFVWIRKHNGSEYGSLHNMRCVQLAINAEKYKW